MSPRYCNALVTWQLVLDICLVGFSKVEEEKHSQRDLTEVVVEGELNSQGLSHP